MDEPLTWRHLLGEIIALPTERQRLATELGVNPISLTRWAAGISNPRPRTFQLLLDALPEHRKQLSRLITQEHADLFMDASEETRQDASQFSIPASFYARIFTMYATTPSILRSSIILDLIVKQVISQLDSDNSAGIKVIVAQFVAPDEKDQPVQSLRILTGGATPPWMEFQTMFLGAESQIGFAILSNHMITIEDFSQEQQTILFPERTIERSSVACPILFAKDVAGCILISSVQPNYFTSSMLSLIQSYAELLILVFEAEDFYPNEKIRLGVMPTYQQQEPYLRSFANRVRGILVQAAQKQQLITRPQAELLVWKELEQKFLKIASSLPSIEKG
jgi:hypothetical protein